MLDFNSHQTPATINAFCIHPKHIYTNDHKTHIACIICDYNACIVNSELKSIRIELNTNSYYIYDDSILEFQANGISHLHPISFKSPIDPTKLHAKLSNLLLLL